MADIDSKFREKPKDRIYDQFPPLKSHEVPNDYEIQLIEFQREHVEEYEVIFWHRLLKSIYREPLIYECALVGNNNSATMPEIVTMRRLEEHSQWSVLTTSEINTKFQSGELKPFPVNWKYIFRLPSGGLVEIGTKDRLTVLYFAHIVIDKDAKVAVQDVDQANKFIASLLAEAKKEKLRKLFDPIKEFKNQEGLKFYQLFNVYRSNYISAEILQNMAASQEELIRAESIKYDARTSDLYDEEKRNHMELYMLASGTYFLSAITYYFMALEGFINLVFHSFLKKDFRDSSLNIEKRFDIEQKLKLMPALCRGFKPEYLETPLAVFDSFLKLKDHRNIFFHAKIEESLRNLGFVEDGFLYGCDVSKYQESFIPMQKNMLTAASVLEVKSIVDKIIQLILDTMLEDTRLLTEEFIMKAPYIPFFILNDGTLSLAKSGQE